MISVTITHPIDQTKIRAQTQYPRRPMLATARNTITTSGVRGLWTGLTGSLLRQGTYGTTRFGVYAWLKERSPDRSRARLVGNGALAGSLAGLVGSPAGKPWQWNLRMRADDESWYWSGCARMGSNGLNGGCNTVMPSTDCTGYTVKKV